MNYKCRKISTFIFLWYNFIRIGDELVVLDDYNKFKKAIAKLVIDFKDEPFLKQYIKS